MNLEDNSKIAVIGGGPAGTFFAHFALTIAHRIGRKISIDIYEPRDFSLMGPKGCNHCGGIVSESLVQLLAAEGINLPSEVVQRGVQSYVVHMDTGNVRIETPLFEKRIATMFRGGGPHGSAINDWNSFDGFLLDQAKNGGAEVIQERVIGIHIDDQKKPVVTTKSGSTVTYDLLVGATGVNTGILKQFEGLGFGFKSPTHTKTAIFEFYLGRDVVKKQFGDAMHVFLLNIPRLIFAALVPKGDFVTMALLGKKIDKELVDSFLDSEEVRNCFPEEWDFAEQTYCKCYPNMYLTSAKQPYTDRIVLIGDSATAKLYKDGIGAAYTTAKAAARTALLAGISGKDFRKHYWKVCSTINNDNSLGRIIFFFTGIIQKLNFAKRGILRMAAKENKKHGRDRHLSMVLWDTFTGSAPYKDIFLRMFKPRFFMPLIKELFLGIFKKGNIRGSSEQAVFSSEAIGKVYGKGEVIIKQGDAGDCMYCIQEGKVEVILSKDDRDVKLAELGEGEFFGEMALFDRETRSSTVRAVGEVRVLTIDEKTLLRRIQSDPSLAFRVLRKMSERIRELDQHFI